MSRTLRTRAVTAAMIGCALVWSAAAAGREGAAQPARSVNDGVYTATQAERGSRIFEGTCTVCHDSARFTGEEFVSHWAGKPLAGLFDAVKTMPEDNPGSLQAQEYADVIAFFLRLNKYPSGDTELAGEAEAMAGIMMAAPRQPR